MSEIPTRPITSSAELVSALRLIQLLRPAQLDKVAVTIENKVVEVQTLAGKLTDVGWLTRYQANEVLQGRGQTLLLGTYTILDRLGEGGMGQVFQARHHHLDRIVALKLIRPEWLTKPEVVKRFHREMKVAARLNHPNIVLTFDADKVGDTHFFTMEYVQGTDLARLIDERGPLPIDKTCAYIRQAALGLKHAFEQGLVHRDIKPHNLLQAQAQSGSEGTIKIAGFGLARWANPEAHVSSLTQEGAMMGTPDYLAPEQVRNSHEVDIRADLYSLGCTFYHMVTGVVPFPEGSVQAKIYRHLSEEPRPVEQLRADVAPPLAAVVRKLMAKNAEERFQTPQELANVLANGGVPVAVAIQAQPPARVPFGVQAPRAPDSPAPAGPAAMGRKARVFWLAALVVLLGWVGVVIYLANRPYLPPTTDLESELFINSLGMKLAPIPPGKFLMGSPPDDPNYQFDEYQHEVEITQPFHMGIHEVTVGQFRDFTRATGFTTAAEKSIEGAYHLHIDGTPRWRLNPKINWRTPGFAQTDDHPVTCLEWSEAVAFCEWLSKKENRNYALPTEAQWEYCCRAGTETRYSSGDDDESLKKIANVRDDLFDKQYPADAGAGKWDDGFAHTAPVGSFAPNRLGLFDMHGNVAELTADWYGQDYYKKSPTQDPKGPESGPFRVCRNGSWFMFAPYHRSATRTKNYVSVRCTIVGFRIGLLP